MPSQEFCCFIARKRAEAGLSRADVVKRASAAGYSLSASYIAKLESGEVSPGVHEARITFDKISALAVGLGVDRAELLALLETVKADNGIGNGGCCPPHATDWERRVMKRIAPVDWGDADPRRIEGFWQLDEATRRRIFRSLESVWLELFGPLPD